MKNKLIFVQYLKSPILIIVIAVLFLITLLGKVSSNNIKLSSSNQILEDQIRQQELKKKRLGLELYYYQTDTFLEKEAKKNLNLKKENEKVIIIPNKLTVNNKPNGQVEIASNNDRKNNVKSWLNFLFGSK